MYNRPMLFFYFIAALNDAPGWMLFWAVLGMLFSSRSTIYFVLPAIVAWSGNANLGVMVVVCTWIYLFWLTTEEAARRNEQREKLQSAIDLAHENAVPTLHQPGKPGA